MSAIDLALLRYRATVGAIRFDKRITRHPEPLRAEAAIFDFLAAEGLHPRLHEDPAFGGVDFECQTTPPFSVEVTTLTSATLATRSGVRYDVMEAGNIDLSEVLAMIRSRISEKGTSRQAHEYQGPRVLAVVSEHYMAPVFFLAAAPELLTGQQRHAWNVGPAGLIGDPFQTTEMKNAAHIRANQAGDIEVFRPKHALILLVALWDAGCQLVGIANPQPSHSLPSGLFETVPTVKLKWPVQDNRLQTQWTLPERQKPRKHYFA